VIDIRSCSMDRLRNVDVILDLSAHAVSLAAATAKRRLWVIASGLLFLLLICCLASFATFGESYALVVGVGRYESEYSDAILADVDAEEFAKALEQMGVERIELLTNESADQASIITWFDAMERRVKSNRVQEDDIIYIYLAGHGGFAYDETGRESQHAAFFPFDYSSQSEAGNNRAITDRELGDLIVTQLKHCSVMVFIDACHSGGFPRGEEEADNGGSGPLSTRGEGVSRGILTAVREADDRGRTWVLASCREYEKSWEFKEQTPAGAFTSYLIEGLTCANTNQDDGITFAELASYVESGVKEFVARLQRTNQRPVAGVDPDRPENWAYVLHDALTDCHLVDRIDVSYANGVATGDTGNAGKIVSFPDPGLEDAVRVNLGLPEGPITDSRVQGITKLDAQSSQIYCLDGIEALENLERLDLRNNEVTDLQPLQALSLRNLHLKSNPLGSLEGIENSYDLLFLDAQDCQIHEIKPLQGLSNLKYLYLRGNSIVDLSPLTSAIKLRELDLGYNNVSSIAALEDMHNLESLLLDFNNVYSLEPIGGCVSLRELELWQNNITDISPLEDLLLLEGLGLSLNPIGDISALKKLVNLTALQLINCDIQSVAALEGLTKLTSLELEMNEIADISPLSNLTSLRKLELNGNEIVDVGPLAGLTDLVLLTIGNNRIDDYTPLENLTELKHLTVFSADISDIGWLRKMTKLEFLYLDWNQIEDLEPLREMTSLERLSIFDNRVHSIEPLSQMYSLQELEATWNSIVCLDPIVDLERLRDLRLSGNAIHSISALVLNQGLGEGDYVSVAFNDLDLVEFSLAYNHIHALEERGVRIQYAPQDGDRDSPIYFPDPGLEAAVRRIPHAWFGAAVLVDDVVRRSALDASSSGIADISGIEYFVGIERLSFFNNDISDISLLQGLTNLDVLDLGYNQIYDISALAMNHGLGNGDVINLEGNAFTLSPESDALRVIEILKERGATVYHDPIATSTADDGDESLELHKGLFADARLEEAVRAALLLDGDHILEAQDLLQLTDLDVTGFGIRSIQGIEQCPNLTKLTLWNNEIEDLAPISSLRSLTWLDIDNNEVSDLSPLSDLSSLQVLYISGNPVDDLSPLEELQELFFLAANHISPSTAWPAIAGMRDLVYLSLAGNGITSISWAAELPNLSYLSLCDNRIQDVEVLATLGPYVILDLASNFIRDASALGRLSFDESSEEARMLDLSYNRIEEISFLLTIEGLVRGDSIVLTGNPGTTPPMSSYTIQTIEWLEREGLRVENEY